MCVLFSTEKWSIKYGSYCIVATEQMKFASEARPSKYIGPFGNTELTCMPLSGHFMDIEGRVLVFFFQQKNGASNMVATASKLLHK